jgi:hypothetical protein
MKVAARALTSNDLLDGVLRETTQSAPCNSNHRRR